MQLHQKVFGWFFTSVLIEELATGQYLSTCKLVVVSQADKSLQTVAIFFMFSMFFHLVEDQERLPSNVKELEASVHVDLHQVNAGEAVRKFENLREI